MTSAPDIKIDKNTWINVTAAGGFAAGDDLIVQNIGKHPVRVENSVTQPAGDTVGLLLNPVKSAQALTDVTENVWVFGRSSASTVHVEAL